MACKISVVKKVLDEAIIQLCDVSWMFSKDPQEDFTRERKLPFRKQTESIILRRFTQ